MARRTKQEADETKNKIIDSAINVFLKKSITSATLEDIAKDAGVTRGAIYWHFKDKVAILDEIFNEAFTPIGQMTTMIVQNPDIESLEKLKMHLKDTLRESVKNKKKRNILCIFLTKIDYSQEIKEFIKTRRDERQQMSQIVNIFFKALQEKGIIKNNFNHEIIAKSLFCYLTGLLTEYFKNPLAIKIEKNYSDYIDLFFSNI